MVLREFAAEPGSRYVDSRSASEDFLKGLCMHALHVLIVVVRLVHLTSL
jgi:hypothetical protein